MKMYKIINSDINKFILYITTDFIRSLIFYIKALKCSTRSIAYRSDILSKSA